jgi:hypothetical protein
VLCTGVQLDTLTFWKLSVIIRLPVVSKGTVLFHHQWLYSRPIVGRGRFSFSFLIPYTVGRTTWTGDQSDASPLLTHRITLTQSKRTHRPRLGWE